MGFLGDLFTGSRPDMRLPGYAQGLLGNLQDYESNIGLGGAGKAYKGMIKQYGQDPASLATLSLSQGAVNKRENMERAGQGANALLGAAGGEQGTLLSNMLANQNAKLDEQTGLNAINEANTKYFGALGGLQDSINARRSAELGTYGQMAGLMNQGYDATRRGGLFNPQTLSGALQGFAQGAGSGLGGGIGSGLGRRIGCWVAAELYGGWNAPEVAILRDFIFRRFGAGRLFAALYLRFGERAARVIQHHKAARWLARRVFDRLLGRALSI